jgi:beta-glucosidase
VDVSVKVTNTGNREGDEVAQLYVRQTMASVATPVKALKGFSRIHLQAGEAKTVTFNLKQADLAVWNANQQWQVEPGEYRVGAGGSSRTELGTKFILK